MRVEVLDYILEVARCGSISAASRKFYIQQTTLSAAIKAIESELNIVLFERYSGGVRLTSQGKAFIELAEPMAEQYRKMQELSKISSEEYTFLLNIIIYNYFCAELYHSIRKKYPEKRITLQNVECEKMLSKLYEPNKNQIAIIMLSEAEAAELKKHAKSRGLVIKYLFTSQMMLCMNKNNPLSQKECLTRDDLRNEHLLLAPHDTKRFFAFGFDKIVRDYSVLGKVYINSVTDDRVVPE